MDIKVVSQSELRTALQQEYGELKPNDQYSREAISNLCRHAAGLLCPVDVRTLKRYITNALEPLGYEDISETLGEVIESLLSLGDLLELQDLTIGENRRTRETLLYAAPPHFVPVSPSRMLLLGVAPDDVQIYPDEINEQIGYKGCLRVLESALQNDIESQLLDLGLYRVAMETWLNAPPAKSPEEYIGFFGNLLGRAGRAGEVSELIIIDPEARPDYYRGRWAEPSSETGRYVGRRSRAFGAQLWCYVELDGGHPRKIIDLPIGGSDERGCDQAWRLQAALDMVNGTPQKLKSSSGESGFTTIGVSSPIPKWVARRWDTVGRAVEQEGTIISYEMPSEQAKIETQFAVDRMWLIESAR